jgi:TolA-binding protein
MRNRLWLFVGLVGLLWTSSADADPESADVCIAKEAKEAVTCGEGKLSVNAKLHEVRYEPPPADSVQKQKKLGPADPEQVTNDTPRIDRELKKKGRQYLLREIATVTKLYRDTPKDSQEKGQLLRRLADDYAELESDLFREQMQTEALSQEVRRINPVRSRHLRGKAKEIGTRVARARKQAIKHYARLAKKHPNYCQFPKKKKLGDRGCTDQALYYLAYEHELAKDYDEARNVYLKIVTDWPKSKYVPHAYLAFGELYFSEAQGDPSRWTLAEQAYEKVTAYPPPDNPLFGYAHYKLAYVHWNQGAYDQALAHFKKVVAFGQKYGALPNAKGLMHAARRDLVPVYATTGKASKAYAFFKPLAGDDKGSSKATYAMMEDLGQALMDTGHYDEARVLYRDLKKRNGGAKSCIYQTRITKATLALAGGKKEPVEDVLADQLAEYLNNRDGGYGDKTRLRCANHTASLIAETAMAWHIEAVGSGGVRGTGDEATMDAAAKLYAMVDENFTGEQFAAFRFPRIVKEDWPTLASLRYHHANLLWVRKRWKQCGRAFYRAYEADPKGKDAGEALFASGQCWQNAVLAARGDEGYRAGRDDAAADAKAYAPRSIEGDEAEMLKAFDRYACRIQPPKGNDDAMEKHCEVKFARARLYFEAQHYDKAALAFREIALDHAQCEASVFAANLYLESMEVMRSKWKRASCVDGMSADAPAIAELHCKTAEQREENPEQCMFIGRTNRDLARLDIQHQIAKLKKGDKNAAKKLAAAGDRYWKLWETEGRKVCKATEDADEGKLTEGCKGYDEILHNAAAAYDGAHLLAKAMSVRRTLINPAYQLHDTKLGRQAVYALGANYQAIAVYDLAAEFYERFASESSKADGAPMALSDAVVLRLGLGESAQALADARTFSRLYGKRQPQQAAQIAFAIGAHHVERGAWRKADKALYGALKQIETHATPDIRVQAHALLGRIYDNTEQRAKADRFYGKARAAATKLAELRKGIETLDEPPRQLERRYGKMVTAVGEALHYFARKQRDKADALRFPEYKGAGTEADINRFVKSKVLTWLGKKKPAIEAATAAYMKIVKLNDDDPPPKWAIAAGAAIGNMWGGLVDDFIEAPYPKKWDQSGYVPGIQPPLLWAELKAIYVGELAKKVAPYKEVAKNAYTQCLKFGLQYQHFDRRVRSCEEWLSKHHPDEFQLVDELASPPSRVSSGLDEHPQPLEVDGTPAAAAKRRRSKKR